VSEFQSPPPAEFQIPEISNEATRQTREEYIRLAHENASSDEVFAAKGRFIDALQVEEHYETTLDHGLWIGLQLAKACAEAGLTEKAVEAAREGWEVAYQAYNDQWLSIFENVLSSLGTTAEPHTWEELMAERTSPSDSTEA